MAPSLRAPTLSDLLRTADSFVAVAGAVCVASLRSCTVTYHVCSGRPLCTVDTCDRTDEERLAYLADGWRRDELMAEMIERRTIVAAGGEMLIPIVEPRGMVASIRCTHDERERELWMTSMLVAVRLIQLGIGAAPDTPAYALTARQRQVAGLAAQGLSTKEIAAELAISPSTVKKLLKKVFDGLTVDNRVELVHRLRTFQVQLDVGVGVTHAGRLSIARHA
jgi:DNA-binding CsgD family transcriptional regulator